MTTALMTLADAAALLPGATLLGDPATPIARVHSDTRTLRPGDLFVALRGDNFDAHAFLPQARAAGADGVGDVDPDLRDIIEIRDIDHTAGGDQFIDGIHVDVDATVAEHLVERGGGVRHQGHIGNSRQ